ncbi:MAG: hypothetical protein ABTQ26_10170 [Azonexus sp.]
MTEVSEKADRPMPKGGRKGGATFPRIKLDEAIGFARKLVGKTHTGPQPQDVILSGVIGAKGGRGGIRMSALKQYGFLKGDQKVNFSACDLAKKIAAAPAEELSSLFRQAILKPTVFKKLFDTFHGDTVSKSKLKQRAADLNVHPDETETCVNLYVSGMTTAGLVTVEGEQVRHLASSHVATVSEICVEGETDPEMADDELGAPELDYNSDIGTSMSANGADEREEIDKAHSPRRHTAQSGPRAVFNVNVTLDSSLDIEKLQKQLELLKHFGAI